MRARFLKGTRPKLAELRQSERRSPTQREGKQRSRIRGRHKTLERRFKSGGEEKRYDDRNIRGGVEFPCAGGAVIVMIPLIAVVVIVQNAAEERHAQIERANDCGCDSGLHD